MNTRTPPDGGPVAWFGGEMVEEAPNQGRVESCHGVCNGTGALGRWGALGGWSAALERWAVTRDRAPEVEQQQRAGQPGHSTAEHSTAQHSNGSAAQQRSSTEHRTVGVGGGHCGLAPTRLDSAWRAAIMMII